MQLALCPCCGKPVRPKAVTPFSSGPVLWAYGSGFPKSLDIGKAIDKAAGVEREVIGANPNARPSDGVYDAKYGTKGHDPFITAPATEAAQLWQGYGTALKPAYEPIIVAMKPIDKTYAHNALTWGVAGINVDGCRVAIGQDDDVFAKNPHTQNQGRNGGWCTSGSNGAGYTVPSGRWPANFVHDGSDEVMGLFPVTKNGGQNQTSDRTKGEKAIFSYPAPVTKFAGDTGSAARFFYCAKASTSERNEGVDDGNNHCTVKPLSLMRWLCRLVSMPNGSTILDPFMGSGTTGVAALLEGQHFVGIEREAEYMAIARQRLAHYEGERSMEPVKVTGKPTDHADLPLFAS